MCFPSNFLGYTVYIVVKYTFFSPTFVPRRPPIAGFFTPSLMLSTGPALLSIQRTVETIKDSPSSYSNNPRYYHSKQHIQKTLTRSKVVLFYVWKQSNQRHGFRENAIYLIWLMWTAWIQLKKDDLAESSFVSLIYGLLLVQELCQLHQNILERFLRGFY